MSLTIFTKSSSRVPTLERSVQACLAQAKQYSRPLGPFPNYLFADCTKVIDVPYVCPYTSMKALGEVSELCHTGPALL